MTDKRHWLITGGAGFIGSHLLHAIVARGEPVRVVDDFSTGLRKRLRPYADRFELFEGTITDLETCRAACEGVTHVLHQAAIPSVQRSIEDPEATHAACATGTLNVLVAARDAGAQRVVYAGSSSAYGDTVELPKRESMASFPRSPYAVAKLTGENYVRTFSGVFGLTGVVLRYFNIFGPGQDPSSQYAAVIPNFITAALEDRAPHIHGDGEQTRDFTYIENVVQANLRAALAPAERVAGEVFNVGCGERITVNRLWREIRDLTGTEVEPTFGPARQGDVRDSLASLDRLREALDFTPEVGLREGLRRTVAAFRVPEPVIVDGDA